MEKGKKRARRERGGEGRGREGKGEENDLMDPLSQIPGYASGQ